MPPKKIKMKFLDNNILYKKRENTNKNKLKNYKDELLYPHLDDNLLNAKIGVENFYFKVTYLR